MQIRKKGGGGKRKNTSELHSKLLRLGSPSPTFVPAAFLEANIKQSKQIIQNKTKIEGCPGLSDELINLTILGSGEKYACLGAFWMGVRVRSCVLVELFIVLVPLH